MTVWVLITTGSLVSNTITLFWAYEVWMRAKQEKKISEQQRRILKEWIESVLDDIPASKKAEIILRFSQIIPGLLL